MASRAVYCSLEESAAFVTVPLVEVIKGVILATTISDIEEGDGICEGRESIFGDRWVISCALAICIRTSSKEEGIEDSEGGLEWRPLWR